MNLFSLRGTEKIHGLLVIRVWVYCFKGKPTIDCTILGKVDQLPPANALEVVFATETEKGTLAIETQFSFSRFDFLSMWNNAFKRLFYWRRKETIKMFSFDEKRTTPILVHWRYIYIGFIQYSQTSINRASIIRAIRLSGLSSLVTFFMNINY